MKRVLPLAALMGGVLSVFIGVYSIGLYVSEAVLARMGDPDQSLMFWYLPFLLFGVMVLALGGGLVYVGLRNLGEKQ